MKAGGLEVNNEVWHRFKFFEDPRKSQSSDLLRSSPTAGRQHSLVQEAGVKAACYSFSIESVCRPAFTPGVSAEGLDRMSCILCKLKSTDQLRYVCRGSNNLAGKARKHVRSLQSISAMITYEAMLSKLLRRVSC